MCDELRGKKADVDAKLYELIREAKRGSASNQFRLFGEEVCLVPFSPVVGGSRKTLKKLEIEIQVGSMHAPVDMRILSGNNNKQMESSLIVDRF